MLALVLQQGSLEESPAHQHKSRFGICANSVKEDQVAPEIPTVQTRASPSNQAHHFPSKGLHLSSGSGPWYQFCPWQAFLETSKEI